MKTVNGACPHDSPNTCAWQVSVDNKGVAVELKGHPKHPFTQGKLCTKLKRYPVKIYDKDRVLYTQKRIGFKGEDKFERISWAEALVLTVPQPKHSAQIILAISRWGAMHLTPRYR